jgi:predicted transcriptional regulator
MVELKATRDTKKKESGQLAVAGSRIMVMERVTGRKTTCRCTCSVALVATILCGAKTGSYVEKILNFGVCACKPKKI